jgi:diguanylate cyclase (GGDEF)-like protein
MSVIDSFLGENPNVRLPTPPAIALHILNEINTPEPSFKNLAQLISADPALTTKVLRIANSPLMAPITPIENLNNALTRLGLTIITNIALSFVLIENLIQRDDDFFNFNYFWKRAITAAVSSSMIANAIKRPNDNIFIAALLQDIGILVAYTCAPQRYTKIEATQDTKHSHNALVTECYGGAHAQLGGELLCRWGLSDNITQPILFHHQPEAAPKAFIGSARTIYLANKLSAALNDDEDNTQKLNDFRAELNYFYDLTGNQINQAIEQTVQLSHELLELLNIPRAQLKSSTKLLQDANEALCTISLNANKLANRYKMEKEAAQKTSAEISSANAELSRLAFQDSLTGLYNQRYFHDFFDRELQRSARYSSDFAFMMLDIDDFKLINDNYGHQAGDKMLQAIATTTLNTVRNTDLVARYGGEEFALILPETTPDVARATAERLRRSIAQMSITWKGTQIFVTASIGLAFYADSNNNLSKQQLIAIADAALYRAKKQGKNKVALPE